MCVTARSVCAPPGLGEIEKKKNEEYNPPTRPDRSWTAAAPASNSHAATLFPLLLPTLRPAAPSGRLGRRKYAFAVSERLSASFILSGSLLHVRHDSKKGKGRGWEKREEDKREDELVLDLGSAVYSQALATAAATSTILTYSVSSLQCQG